MGKKQPILFGSIFMGIAVIMLIISAIMILFVDLIIGIIILTQVIFPIIFGLVFYSSLRKKDYYNNYAYLILGKEKVKKKDLRKFIEWFLRYNEIGTTRKRDRNKVQYTWWFRGKREGHIFIISDDDHALAVGIKDQDGKSKDLVQDFILMLNAELDKKNLFKNLSHNVV